MPLVESRGRAQVLVTGDRGMVGTAVVDALRGAGLGVVGLDLVRSEDVLEPAVVRERVAGCDFVVHLAALDDEPDERGPLDPSSTGTIEQIIRTNVGGTSILLHEAAKAGVRRVVLLSSVDVFGCFMGQGQPAYLPIDDQHPLNPKGAYAWSKLAGEELAAAFTAETGAPSICLRAPGVFEAATYAIVREARAAEPTSEWDPFWEYGAFIDVRDLASAVVAALTVPDLEGHHRLLVNADDISSRIEDAPTLAARILPNVPLRRSGRTNADDYAALIDSEPARALLNWAPQHRWRPKDPATDR